MSISPGTRFGSYEIVESIGSGGMGEVYRARRIDAKYEKEVAIKLVPAGLPASFILKRLRAERQILARLDHPHIAQLIDGGATEEGFPYLVMDLVEGIPQTITVSDEEVRQALNPCVSAIVDAVRVALERTPPELSADIIDRGVVLTGGGALLANLDKRLRTETGLPVFVADDPLTSVVLGAGKNSIRIAPPLVLSRSQADSLLRVMDDALGEVGRGV